MNQYKASVSLIPTFICPNDRRDSLTYSFEPMTIKLLNAESVTVSQSDGLFRIVIANMFCDNWDEAKEAACVIIDDLCRGLTLLMQFQSSDIEKYCSLSFQAFDVLVEQISIDVTPISIQE